MNPYPRYRDSGVEWLGEVPEHWEAVSLRWCSIRYAGGTPDRNQPHYWDDGTIPWINSGAVNQRLITEPSALITDEGFSGSSAKWIPAGALVMALAGQGRTKGMIAQLALSTTCNQSMAAIVPDERVSARYVFWLLDAQYEVVRNLAGGEQRDGLNLEILGSLSVLLPPLDEQRAIAAHLDRETERIDALVAKKRLLIERLEEYRTALITRTVTRGLPPEPARAAGLDPSPRLKPSGVEWLGEVPEHWEVKPVRSLASFRGGATPAKSQDEFWDGDIPWVSPKDMKRASISDSEDHVTDAALAASSIALLPIGSVLVVVRGMILAHSFPVAVTVGPVTINQDMKALITTNPLSHMFLYWYLVGRRRVVVSLCDESAHGTRRLETASLAALAVAVPPNREQHAIVAFLDRETARLDELTGQVENAIERLQEYRTALITAAVTGKIDVRE